VTPPVSRSSRIVITGASDKGLGGEMAIALAHANPAHLILLARSQTRVDPVINRINALNPNIKTTFIPISLDDLTTVRQAASSINDLVSQIDILINNAGIMAIKTFTTNNAGIESQFATNHIGHFLFTKLLFPKLLSAATSTSTPTSGTTTRIVNVTSLGHKIGPVRFTDHNFSNGTLYDEWSAYGQSKTANILFSLYLATAFKSKDIKMASFAPHPGAIFGTNLASHIDDIMGSLAAIDDIAVKNTGRHFPLQGDAPKPIETGISTALVAALDPRIEGQSGMYMADNKPEETYEYAQSLEGAERLWRLSEELVGEKWEL
jgi:NAD(P)-dependent dehydrogenase (short-subunit alcohol dehydrogenase family)